MKAPSSRSSCVDRVAMNIREFIRSEKLQAGDRLPVELKLAESLQVSRNALREAISRLESIGLLEVRHGLGTYVAGINHLTTCVDFVVSALTISPLDLMQYAEMRSAIECAAAPLCAVRATPEGVAELADLYAAMHRPELSYLDALKADFDFHRKIVALTGNVLMQNLTEVLHRTFFAGMVHATPNPRDLERSHAIHGPILQAIRDGNAKKAKAAMEEHMEAYFSGLRHNVHDANRINDGRANNEMSPSNKTAKKMKAPAATQRSRPRAK